MLVAMDFDHTINNNSDIQPGERFSKPYPKVRETIEAIRSTGNKVMIFSCNRKAWIEEWMAHHEIPYDYIWDGAKPVYDVLIDDRAIGFRGDWGVMLEEMEKLSGKGT